ncbi:MAG: glycine--tRNA ligase subunit beta [Thermodesulfovibrionia bacterium]|nr:glycine--tRNA ligase subunit beta [Thermodesulfovibrionia bacterium]
MKPLLLEIGTEEIPARFIPSGITALKNSLIKLLRNASIDFQEIREFATPRRLTILIKQVSEKQKDRQRDVLGPSKKIAFDKQNQPTKASIGFAKTHNVDINTLKVVKTERGEYVAATIEEKGKDTKTVLASLLPKAITSLQFPKSMRWGSGTLRFARPIRWIAALYGTDVIDFELEGLKSSNLTRGHRFISPGPLVIQDPFTYQDLLAHNYVLADPEHRKKIIIDGIKKIESHMNINVHQDTDLLNTVTFLVEYPTVISGNFDTQYLSLPEELLITTMRSHQKYFSVENKDGKLLSHFVLVSNAKSENNEIIKKGAERVLKARLEDAKFYYDDDQKKSLWDFVEKLKEVTFQETLGSLFDKVQRIAFLCSFFADELDLKSKEKLLRAAMLSKADLVTGIVREFPELQGYMGMVYARNSGEDNEVALAMYEHYMPRFSGDMVPSTEISTFISLTDKMDNIASFFVLGMIPTGSEDPYALRRQAMGIINILQKTNYPLSLEMLISKSLEGIESYPPARNQLRITILNFFQQRLEGMLSEEGYSHDIIDSVLSSGVGTIKDTKNRIKILTTLITNPDFPELLTAAKRVYNILAKLKTGKFKKSLLTETSEKELYTSVLKAEGKLRETNFQVLFELRDPINVFFDKVLVMDKKHEIKENRLALLAYVKKIFDSLADFSKIVTHSS